jgi:hypothetical protein
VIGVEMQADVNFPRMFFVRAPTKEKFSVVAKLLSNFCGEGEGIDSAHFTSYGADSAIGVWNADKVSEGIARTGYCNTAWYISEGFQELSYGSVLKAFTPGAKKDGANALSAYAEGRIHTLIGRAYQSSLKDDLPLVEDIAEILKILEALSETR